MTDGGTFERAPAADRPQRVVTLPGGTYRITQLPPRRAFRVSFRMLRQLGPLLSSLIGGGIVLRNAKGEAILADDGTPRTAGLVDLLTSPTARKQIAAEVTKGLGAMSEADALDLADELVAGSVERQMAGGAWMPLATPTVIDEIVPDVWTLFALVRESAGLSVVPTSAADDTDDGSAAAETKAKPGATS